jgi:adhesin/invasin
MMPRKAIKFWLPAFALAVMITWFGCEQKGDISPTGSRRRVLVFIDTVNVNPNPVGPGDTASVQARILTETMEPATDEDVRFSVTRGTLGSGTEDTTVQSDGSGIARTTFTAPPDTGSVLVRAELLSMSETRTSTVHVTTAPINEGLLSVWSDADSLYADNGVSSTRVYARLRDASNSPIGGATIYFSTNIGSIASPSVTNDTTGVAQTMLVSTSETGQAVIVARYEATTDTVRVFFLTPSQASSIFLTVEPDVLEANGTSQASLRALVLDGQNQPVPNGTTVTFTSEFGVITAGQQTEARHGKDRSQQESASKSARHRHEAIGGSAAFERSQSDQPIRLDAAESGRSVIDRRFGLDEATSTYTTTTINGYAYATLTSATTVTTDHIVASVGALSDTKTVEYVAGIPATLTLTAQMDTLQANGIAIDSITAHVVDSAGHVLPNVEVMFSTTIGNITLSRVTDANGDARVAFTSSQTGIAHIAATAGSATDSYTIYLIPGVPNSILLTYFPNSVGVRGSGRNETLLITATVRDASNNNVLDGTLVTFNIVGSPGGGDHLSSTDPLPTINGEVSVSYSSGTISGSVRIRAVAEDISALSTEILIYAGPPYIENIADGCLTSHMSLSATPCSMFGMDFVGDSVQLTVLIGDRYNNPVPAGTAVYFTTSGGVITTSTGYTNDNGFAYVTLYSGNPLPTISRWVNTLTDPNNGGPILCSPAPTQDGMAKVLVTSAGVDANGDSVTVWAATNVVFDYRTPYLAVREVTVNGDPTVRELYIGESALVTIAVYDQNYWPLVDSSLVEFSANAGRVYPETIAGGCPGDTSYTVSFFNNLTVQDNDVATPVLIVVNTRQNDAFAFTESLTLHASLPPDSLVARGGSPEKLNGN